MYPPIYHVEVILFSVFSSDTFLDLLLRVCVSAAGKSSCPFSTPSTLTNGPVNGKHNVQFLSSRKGRRWSIRCQPPINAKKTNSLMVDIYHNDAWELTEIQRFAICCDLPNKVNKMALMLSVLRDLYTSLTKMSHTTPRRYPNYGF